MKVDLAEITEKQLKSVRKYIQMIFQDPFSSLNPRMTVADIIAEPLKIHDSVSRNEIKDAVAEMMHGVGLHREDMNRYPHSFSGGQRQRISIARALIMKPSVVIADEAVSALDVSIQAQIINLLKDLQEQFALSYVFVAHDLSVVRYISDTVAVMYNGKIVELAPCEAIFEKPYHPYTQLLLRAMPSIDPDKKISADITDMSIENQERPKGCCFCAHCKFCKKTCYESEAVLRKIEQDRYVACNLFT